MARANLPSVGDLYNPVLEALHRLGGEAGNADINAVVIEFLGLSPEQLASTYESESRRTESIIANRMTWARSHLKIAGLIEQPRRTVWRLTDKGRTNMRVDVSVVRQAVHGRSRTRKTEEPAKAETDSYRGEQPASITVEELLEEKRDWRAQLLERIYALNERQLEAFFQRMFAYQGMDNVEVIQADRVGGIEGIVSGGGILSLQVYFWFVGGGKLLGSDEVSEFRDYASASRADKAVFITTGKFTPQGMLESERASALNVQLIDGEKLIDLMKSQGMGVRTERIIVERTIIDEDWFKEL